MQNPKLINPSKERPSGLVRQYILHELRPKPGILRARLPAIRELSKQLGVGVSTVQVVYRELAEEGYIESTVGNGSYLLAEKLAGDSPIQAALNINSRMMSEVWYQDIVSGMMTEVARQPMSVAITTLHSQSLDREEIQKDFDQHIEGIDGAILFPSLAQRSLVKLLDESKKSYVTINPVSPSAPTNFVSPAYFDDGWRAGRAFAKAGRKRLFYLCSQSFGSPLHSVSARLRLGGLLSGFSVAPDDSQPTFDISARITIGQAENVSAEAGYHLAMQTFSDHSISLPDAFFCSGLPLAAGIVRFLRERNVRIPEETAVVAGSRLDRMPPELLPVSTIGPRLQDLGAAAMKMLCHRVTHDNTNLPGEIFPGIFTDGGTTSETENHSMEDTNP